MARQKSSITNRYWASAITGKIAQGKNNLVQKSGKVFQRTWCAVGSTVNYAKE